MSYGITYKSDTGTYDAPSIQALKRDGVQFIRVTWVDYTNCTRFRVLPIRYFEKLVATKRPGISIVQCALGIVGLTLAHGFSSSGEYYFVTDLNSLRYCPYAPGHASVFGWFEEKIPSPNSTSLSVDLCPRTILQKLVAEAQEIGIKFLVGIETEFILLKGTDPIEPLDYHDYSIASSLYTGTLASEVLEEIATALRLGGIEVQVYHAEAAPGQFEIVTAPLQPLEAADALVFTRETIANIANKHKLRSTLAPRVFNTSCGSAAHTNVSIHSTDEGPNSPLAPTLKSYEASFLQSLLENLPAICALTMPTAASYGRMGDGLWSGGTYISWGTENREAPIRITGPPGGHRFELRTVDGTASPYLVLAGVIAAGIAGLKAKKQLKFGDSVEAPALLTAEGRAKLGISEERLPMSIEEARKNFSNNAMLKQYLGENFATKYLAVNEILQTHLSADSPDAEMKKIVEFY